MNARLDSEGLARLHPPGAWAERHRRLAGQVHVQATLSTTMDQREVAQMASRQMKARARADGYVDCGR